MLPSSIRNQLLVDEGQLGQRLNLDLQHGDRADFRLQLALLTDAVEEQPWFDAKPAASSDKRDWRAHFELREAQVLMAEGAGSDCSAINERLQQGEHGRCAALAGTANAATGSQTATDR